MPWLQLRGCSSLWPGRPPFPPNLSAVRTQNRAAVVAVVALMWLGEDGRRRVGASTAGLKGRRRAPALASRPYRGGEGGRSPEPPALSSHFRRGGWGGGAAVSPGISVEGGVVTATGGGGWPTGADAGARRRCCHDASSDAPPGGRWGDHPPSQRPHALAGEMLQDGGWGGLGRGRAALLGPTSSQPPLTSRARGGDKAVDPTLDMRGALQIQY